MKLLSEQVNISSKGVKTSAQIFLGLWWWEGSLYPLCIHTLDLSTVLFREAVLQGYFHNNIHILALGYSLETHMGKGVVNVGSVGETKQIWWRTNQLNYFKVDLTYFNLLPHSLKRYSILDSLPIIINSCDEEGGRKEMS